ncbi:MAG: 5'/3'-nucleotidase SurE [Turneriella sp.]|nr:5'/3'-nucleotidase SurE [Leptospiraceae bacterium]MCX7633111.1 5'/3'-nucleotidase SurE [Turneriella sp.]
MRILICNDDGLSFPGLLRLRERLERFGETWVFAPAEEKSATSMALSINNDIPVIRIDDRTYEVDSYPVDCVNIALHGNLAPPFDFCVSGINKGVNMGQDIWYSGTVGAARHAFIHGVPSFAVSCGYADSSGDFAKVADIFAEIFAIFTAEADQNFLLNINIPMTARDASDLKWAKLGRRIYRDNYQRKQRQDGSMLFNLGGSILSHGGEKETDFYWFDRGCPVITPLTIDATDYEKLRRHIPG